MFVLFWCLQFVCEYFIPIHFNLELKRCYLLSSPRINILFSFQANLPENRFVHFVTPDLKHFQNEDERESSEPRLPPAELIFTATDDTTAEPSLGVHVMDPMQCPQELKVTEPSHNQVKEPSSIESLNTDCSSEGHHCTVEGHHILGEICLVCRPLNLLQQDTQPLHVQQQA